MGNLSHDLFPVIATVDGKRYPQTRVMVSKDGRAVAWMAQQGKLQKVADAEQVQVKVVKANRKWTVGEWECSKNGSCGCGSPLKQLKVKEAFN